MSKTSRKRARRTAVDPTTTADFDFTSAEVNREVSVPSTFSVEEVSEDRRRIIRDFIPLPSPSAPSTPNAGTPAPDPSANLDAARAGSPNDWDAFLMPEPELAETESRQNAESRGESVEEQRAKRYATSDEPMKSFIPKRDLYLSEMLRRDGRGHATNDKCLDCPDPAQAGVATIRCSVCAPGPLCCEACAVRKHAGCPYHRIQRWTGRTFENVTLKELGLVIQLGHHHDRSICTNPQPSRSDFSVIDVNGRHLVAVNFCGCDNAGKAGNVVEQLLRFDLWPATDCEPNTVFTFQMLEHYHVQSLQGKMSMYDYYASLERLTDNTGTTRAQDRYKAFMRVVAQWRHLKLLKRAGRGHDPTGVAGTKQGELALRCPACPHVGINLPDNWATISDDLKYLYMMTVAIDACFRLKRRDVSDTNKDPILGSGWAYFVEDTGYHEVLAGYGDQKEMSTCTGLSAVDHANTKFSQGYAATGVGAVMCARHGFWLAHGIGDIQKGEKYINMDYIFVCAMKEYLIVNKLVSYDIACQWSLGLLERIEKFPRHLQIELPADSISYVIPKLHFGAHKREGHSPYSLNYRVGAGRTDAETPERGWWYMQAVASSTKAMGPGTRQGHLDDQFGHSNWRKTVDMPSAMAKGLRIAQEAYAEQSEIFDDLTKSLNKNYDLVKWEREVKLWEMDPFNRDDPYVILSQGKTEAEALRELSEEEQRASAVPGFVALNDVSPVGFITMGLELEEAKFRLQEDAKTATASRVAGLFERRTALRRRVQKFRAIQGVYMPRAIMLLEADPACRTDIERIEEVRLGLPSEISSSRREAVCTPRLQEIEARLREGQCRDALQNVRNKLHTLSHLYLYKKTHVRHQGASTRARSEISTQDVRKGRAVAKYRRARRAKLALSGRGAWEAELRVLEDEDVRGIHDDDPATAKKRKRHGEQLTPAEGRRILSWIWRSGDVEDAGESGESLRVEWLKARARSMRWREEIRLLREEMRRVLGFHLHTENEWLARARSVHSEDPSLREGLIAYALKQARIRRRMRAVCRARCMAEARKSSGREWEESEEWAAVPDAEVGELTDEAEFDAVYGVDDEALDDIV